jgi:uncharacterized repeat protein (TIGR03843 family)
MNTPTIQTAIELEKPCSLPYDRVVTALREGEIVEELGLMRWGTNYTFLVQIKHEDVTFLGIYKPRMGERPLWDFPDGTLCQREAAAWVLSDALAWGAVPPTMLREGSRGIGSVQVFIDHDPQRHYFNFEPEHASQLQFIAALDVLINNADRKGGHCLLDPMGHIWAIDHGLTFNTVHKLRTVIWDFAGQPLNEDIQCDLEALCIKLEDAKSPLRKTLAPLLAEQETKALQNRLRRMLNARTYPNPGPGPNRPWPAI